MQVLTSTKLGFSPESRLLIINADDFGMCHDENEATIDALSSGRFSSATVLVPCPWFEEAAEFARSHPQADIGVHLALTSEWPRYKWGPILGARAVPSLVDGRGYFWPDVQNVYSHANLDEIEAELHAQVEKALTAGIDVTHLDSHAGALHMNISYHRIYSALAREYYVPLRVLPRKIMVAKGFGGELATLDRFGILYPDWCHFGGPTNVDATEGYWSRVIRGLKPGLSEIYCHPAIAGKELTLCAEDAYQREEDFHFFTSERIRHLLHEEGIVSVNYGTLRTYMHQGTPGSQYGEANPASLGLQR
jgi:predicted glycoside hydrolase/deacetylase ChbG (UPF0249 family)